MLFLSRRSVTVDLETGADAEREKRGKIIAFLYPKMTNVSSGLSTQLRKG
jgi:hypothetical protein